MHVESSPVPASLTEREREVLGYLAMGCANKDIGRHLAISLSTVKSHLSTLYRKLGVETRTQALAHAYSRGVLDLR
jgi:ATP/maltotriose-dependent transcriptional regulator MalT